MSRNLCFRQYVPVTRLEVAARLFPKRYLTREVFNVEAYIPDSPDCLSLDLCLRLKSRTNSSVTKTG